MQTLLISVLAAAGVASTASAQTTDGHKIVTPQEIKWAAGPASLPPGAEAASLYGDASKEELFALRLKLPKGYRIPPHTHPKPEVVTIISGTALFGMGATADQSKAEPLPTGSFIALPPGMAHYVFIDEDAVVQLNSIGPWSLTYVNPKDDPRQRSQ